MIGLGIHQITCIQINATQDWKSVAVTETADDPALKRATELLAALLQSRRFTPRPFTFLNRTEAAAVLHQLVVRPAQARLNVFCQHVA